MKPACWWCQRLLAQEAVSGEATRSRTVTHHLQRCAECRLAAGEFQQVSRLLDREFPLPPVSSDFDARLWAAIDRTPARSGPQPWGLRATWSAALAVMVLAVTLAGLTWGRGGDRPFVRLVSVRSSTVATPTAARAPEARHPEADRVVADRDDARRSSPPASRAEGIRSRGWRRRPAHSSGSRVRTASVTAPLHAAPALATQVRDEAWSGWDGWLPQGVPDSASQPERTAAAGGRTSSEQAFESGLAAERAGDTADALEAYSRVLDSPPAAQEGVHGD